MKGTIYYHIFRIIQIISCPSFQCNSYTFIGLLLLILCICLTQCLNLLFRCMIYCSLTKKISVYSCWSQWENLSVSLDVDGYLLNLSICRFSVKHNIEKVFFWTYSFSICVSYIFLHKAYMTPITIIKTNKPYNFLIFWFFLSSFHEHCW